MQNLYNKYLTASKNVQYVSFDMFDTLVKRNVTTCEEIFLIVSMIFENKFQRQIPEFPVDRKEAEIMCWGKTKQGFFNLDNIYKVLEKKYNKEDLCILKTLEKKVELTLIQPNFMIKEIWEDAIKHHKVLITSDMYLDEVLLRKMLSKCAFSGYEKLYISGIQKAYKSDGSLFELVKRDCGNKRILHIGDNLKGDYIKAKQKKLKAIWLTDHTTPSYYNKKNIKCLGDSLVYAMISNHSSKNFWDDFGFRFLGPFITAYSQWLYEQLEKRGIRKVIFLSRDGYVLKKAFDIFNKNDQITSDYMYISRKSSIIPNLSETKCVKDMLGYIKPRHSERFSEILNRLGIKLSDKGKDFVIKRKDLMNGKYDDLLSKYYGQIKNESKKQRSALKQYCENLFDENEIAIVDIGWNGSIQDNLQDFLNSENIHSNITGFYIGLNNEMDQHKVSFMKKDYGFDPNIIPFTRGAFESLFTADHPSVSGYTQNKGKVIIEFSSIHSTYKTRQKIELLQTAAQKFVQYYIDSLNKLKISNITISQSFVSQAMLQFVCYPTLKDARSFGSVEFNDVTNKPLIDDKISHKKCKLKSSFLESDWKAGFLSLYFKKRFPYGKFLAVLNKLRKS